MISVPNHPQRSNGSKWLWIGLLLISFSFSCDLFKKLPDDDPIDQDEDLTEIQGPVQRDPVTGEIEVVTTLSAKMDTVKWTVNAPDKFPPITSETVYVPGSGTTGTGNDGSTGPYRMSMLLPFFTDRFYSGAEEIYDNSTWALQYYLGARLAMEQLTKENANLIINIYDTRGNEATTNQLLNSQPALSNAHLIMGPYLSNNARLVAEFGKRNEIPVVVPYSPSSNLSRANSFLIQANPTFATHAQQIVQHVRSRYDADQVVLVVPNKPEEVQRLRYFQDANYEYIGRVDSTAAFQEFVVMDESADLKDTKIGPYLRADKKTIFIMPTWQNETFIYSFLRKLKIAQSGFSEVAVYGMPQWMEFEQIDYSLYEDLNVHISNFFYTDDYDPEIKKFKQDFFNANGVVPSEEAYVGYGLTLYFGRMLSQYGPGFLKELENADAQSLYTTYQFRRVIDPLASADSEVLNQIERYENHFLHILKFEDYFFHPVE